MSSTEDLDRISAIVAAAGAKLLYTGDHEQLAAVGAGGMLELLVRDAGAQVLTEIHRFTHTWERAASARLRVGDPDVVAVYDAHGRIRGGTEQEMVASAVRGYLADVLQGHRSLLVVRSDADGQGAVGADPRRAGRRRAGLGRGARRDQRRQPRRRRRPDPGPPQRLHPARPRRPSGHQPRDVRGHRPQPVDRHADRARPRRDPGPSARRLRPAAHHAGLRGHLLRSAGPDGLLQPQPGRPGHHPGRGVRAGHPRHRRQHLLRHLPARPRPPRPRADRPHTGGGADRHPHPPRRPHHRRRDRPPRRARTRPARWPGSAPSGTC